MSGAVIVASTRAARGIYPDATGPVMVSFLAELGIDASLEVVVDGAPVGEAIRRSLRSGARVVLTSGGTGLTPTDCTPEATRPLLDREIPGIAEAIRLAGVAAGVSTAMLSRGLAGLVGDALVINLPGSVGGVQDAITVLRPVISHALDQAHGGDHMREASEV